MQYHRKYVEEIILNIRKPMITTRKNIKKEKKNGEKQKYEIDSDAYVK